MRTTIFGFTFAATLVAAGCSDTGGSISGSGGRVATGGISSTGGTVATGGSGSTGGAVATGGVVATGGSPRTGGTATGGIPTTGGIASTGGLAQTGGAATGGTVKTDGGMPPGDAGIGGTPATGGARTGGTVGTGGSAVPAILGATPPMGWNSWNKYACDGLNETVVMKMADAFITSGMKDAGYEYVNLDDCWMDGRDSGGKLKWNTGKFPSGIPALAEYIHGKGLKIGIYEPPANKTCAGLYGGYAGGVGSLGHETTDAQSFASWGIDYLKYDKCTGPLSAFATMYNAIRATGRSIFISINPGDQGPYCTPTNCSIDLPKVANMWRIEFDISANWAAVTRLIDANKKEYTGAGPGSWNDPDMLEVGNGLNDTEGRAHFSMWAIMASPLITGNDLSSMSAATKAILTNKEAIAINQDSLGKQGRVVATPGSNLEVWSKDLAGTNSRAVALFNRSTGSASITVKWSDIGIPAGSATVRDVWAAKDLGPSTDSYTGTNIASHSVLLLIITSAP